MEHETVLHAVVNWLSMNRDQQPGGTVEEGWTEYLQGMWKQKTCGDAVLWLQHTSTRSTYWYGQQKKKEKEMRKTDI